MGSRKKGYRSCPMTSGKWSGQQAHPTGALSHMCPLHAGTVAEVFLYFTDLCSFSLCRISVRCWQGLPIIFENSQRYSYGHSCKRLCFFCSGLYQCLIPKKPLERGACMTAVASTFVQILKTSRFPGMLQNILNPGADIAQGREPDLRPTLRCCPVSFIILLKHLQKDQLSQYPPKTINQTN